MSSKSAPRGRPPDRPTVASHRRSRVRSESPPATTTAAPAQPASPPDPERKAMGARHSRSAPAPPRRKDTATSAPSKPESSGPRDRRGAAAASAPGRVTDRTDGLDPPDTEFPEGVEDVDEEGDDAARIQHPYDPSKTQISTDRTNLDTLLKRLRHGELELQPEFQRAVVWNTVRMSRLIESLLIRIPLPAFYFDGTDDDRWLVVDGLQRLSTLQRFVLAKDGDPGGPLSLTGLEYLVDLEGKTYGELPRTMQRRIDEAQVVVHIIRPGTPPEVKYNIFRRINTGGMVLTPQEIRHALNRGPAPELLKELATDEAFTKATAGAISPQRMLDREIVLRFCAFTLTPYSEYREGNLDTFLTRAMATLNKISEGERRGLGVRFRQAMTVAYDIFGTDAFRKRRDPDARRQPINKAVFEPWSVHLGDLSPRECEQLVARRDRVIALHIQAMNEPEFFAAISQGTGDVAKVHLRFKRVALLIRRVLKEDPT